MKRIGLLTSGGDCQALNATMRGVVKGLSHNLTELEVYGFMDGYNCLLYTSIQRHRHDVRGLSGQRHPPRAEAGRLSLIHI